MGPRISSPKFRQQERESAALEIRHIDRGLMQGVAQGDEKGGLGIGEEGGQAAFRRPEIIGVEQVYGRYPLRLGRPQ